MVPATAGLVSAILIFGILLGFFALPGQLQASSDVPLMLYTAPQLEQSAFGSSLSSIGDDSVVIEAYVDASGRVQDYRILSQPDDLKSILPEVKKILIFTTFRPALSMGRPTAGRARVFGMPVGLQLIGNYFDEARLLAVTHALQQATDWHHAVPSLA